MCRHTCWWKNGQKVIVTHSELFIRNESATILIFLETWNPSQIHVMYYHMQKGRPQKCQISFWKRLAFKSPSNLASCSTGEVRIFFIYIFFFILLQYGATTWDGNLSSHMCLLHCSYQSIQETGLSYLLFLVLQSRFFKELKGISNTKVAITPCSFMT